MAKKVAAPVPKKASGTCPICKGTGKIPAVWHDEKGLVMPELVCECKRRE